MKFALDKLQGYNYNVNILIRYVYTPLGEP